MKAIHEQVMREFYEFSIPTDVRPRVEMVPSQSGTWLRNALDDPSEHAAEIAALGVPVVLLEDPPPGGRLPVGHPLVGAPCVRMDSRAVGRMAAEYYLARVLPFRLHGRHAWTLLEPRAAPGFSEGVHAAGFPCDFYGGPFSERERASWAAERPRMIRFLRAAAPDGDPGGDGRAGPPRPQGNLPIGEIAQRCGFAGTSVLSILFRRITGTTMRDWRRENRESPDL